MRRLLLCAILLWMAAAPALGQETVVEGNVAKTKTPSLVRLDDLKNDAARLLKSKATRERTWGAYLVGQHDLKELTPALIETLNDASLGDGWDESIVRQAALDSLIRLKAKVPADALKSLPANFPDEKIILMAREPEEHKDALLEMFEGELAGEAGPDARWLAVGNLLAETRAQGFSAALLRGLKIEAEVTIVDRETNLGYGYGSSGGCGGGEGILHDDLPPVGFYKIFANARRGAVVLAPGRHPVYFLRTERFGGSSCDNHTPYARDFYRVEYLADLLDTTADALKLDERAFYTIVCKEERECRTKLIGLRRGIEQSYAAMVAGLVEKGLLDASDAAALPPDITFTFHDQRQKRAFPLPKKLKGIKLVIEEAEAAPDTDEQ